MPKRNILSLCHSIYLCTLATQAFGSTTHVRCPVYASASYRPLPSHAILTKWLDQVYDIDDRWIFRDRPAFERILADATLTVSQKSAVRSLFRSELNDDEWARAISWHGPEALALQGFVFVPYDLWEKLPREFIHAVYEHEFGGPLSIDEGRRDELKSHGFTDGEVLEIIAMVSFALYAINLADAMKIEIDEDFKQILRQGIPGWRAPEQKALPGVG